MTFSEILKISIFSTDNFSLTVDKVFIVAIIIIITSLLLRIIHNALKKRIQNNSPQNRSHLSLYHLIKYFIWVIIIAVCLEIIGIKMSVLLASGAALLVGIGLGIQQLFNDVTSGIVLLFERNLKIGDIIQLQDGTVGKVTEISLRTSKVRTRDDIIQIIPNSKFVNDTIINWSHVDYKTRFNITVGVAYGSDTELVKNVLYSCAISNKSIANEPNPFIRFNDFGESSLDFQLFFWVQESFMVENIKSQLRFEIDKAFRENNITIPFPQRDLHIKK